jgi:dTDP-glucose pyrophosphorylase
MGMEGVLVLTLLTCIKVRLGGLADAVYKIKDVVKDDKFIVYLRR